MTRRPSLVVAKYPHPPVSFRSLTLVCSCLIVCRVPASRPTPLRHIHPTYNIWGNIRRLCLCARSLASRTLASPLPPALCRLPAPSGVRPRAQWYGVNEIPPMEALKNVREQFQKYRHIEDPTVLDKLRYGPARQRQRHGAMRRWRWL